MKHITIALDEKVLEDVQRYATDRGITVDEVVREYLTGMAPGAATSDPDFRARIREQLAKLGERTPGRLGDWKWSRDDIYAERFSRYEHPGLRSHDRGRESGEVGKSK